MLVSGVQQSDSVRHVHIFILFQIPFSYRLSYVNVFLKEGETTWKNMSSIVSPSWFKVTAPRMTDWSNSTSVSSCSQSLCYRVSESPIWMKESLVSPGLDTQTSAQVSPHNFKPTQSYSRIKCVCSWDHCVHHLLYNWGSLHHLPCRKQCFLQDK